MVIRYTFHDLAQLQRFEDELIERFAIFERSGAYTVEVTDPDPGIDEIAQDHDQAEREEVA